MIRPQTTDDRRQTPAGPIVRWEWALLACILIVGGLLRFTYLQEIRNAPDFAQPGLDPEYYDYWARALNTGDWTQPKGQADPLIPDIPFLRSPGYPYFLAAVYSLTDMSYLGARIVQMGLGMLSVVLIFFLARALYGRAVALVAASFLSAYWILIYFEGELNAPVLSVFLILCLMHALRRWEIKKTGFRLAVAGVCLGLLTIVRAEGILMLPVLAAWACWAMRKDEGQSRKDELPTPSSSLKRRAYSLLAAVVSLFCGFAVTIAPVTIRNYLKEHDLVLINMSGGINLHAGNNKLADGTWPQVDLRETAGVGKEFTNYDIPLIVRGLERKLGRDDITYAGFSRYYRDLALQYMRENPSEFLRLLTRKAVIFWSPYEISNNKVLYFEKQNSPVLRYMPGFPYALGLFLMGLALFLLDLKGRRGSTATLHLSVLFLLYIVTQYVTIVPFHITARYRISIMPFLLLFGAYGVCRIGTFIAERDVRKALGWTLLASLLIGLCHIRLVSYEYDKGKWHNDRAEAYALQGNYGPAEQELRQAIEAKPGAAPYHTQLGGALAAQGRFDEALQCYVRAVEINPGDGLTLNNLAYALDRQGKTDQAADLYKRAIAADPFLPIARFNLGYLLLDRGDYEGAIGQFNAVRKIDPNNQNVDFNLGRAMVQQGKTREAMTYFNAALTLHPKNPQILNAMALLLFSEGKLEEAAALYQEILRQDPTNPDAHFNMAVAMEALGRLDEAIEYYRKSQALNPEDAIAREYLEKALRQKDRR